jgi:hypothetical protein
MKPRRTPLVATGRLQLMREPPAELVCIDETTVRARLAAQLEQIVRRWERLTAADRALEPLDPYPPP